MLSLPTKEHYRRYSALKGLIREIGFPYFIMGKGFNGLIINRFMYTPLFNIFITKDGGFGVSVVPLTNTPDSEIECAYGKDFQIVKDFIKERTDGATV